MAGCETITVRATTPPPPGGGGGGGGGQPPSGGGVQMATMNKILAVGLGVGLLYMAIKGMAGKA